MSLTTASHEEDQTAVQIGNPIEEKKVADSADFKQKLAFARSRLLMDNLLGAEGKAALTDDAKKRIYGK